MPHDTQENLGAKSTAQSEQLMAIVKQGFDDVSDRLTAQDQYMREQFTAQRLETISIKEQLAGHEARFERIEKTLATLVDSVDHFIKIYTNLNEEMIVLRQHVRDMEERVGKLELKLKTA